MAIHSLITAFCSPQALQKICLTNHIHSLAELLHADVIQQLEVALLGIPAAKILDVLMMATKSETSSTPLSSKLLHSATTLLATTPCTIVLPPKVPIVGVIEVEEPPLVEASTSKKIPSPSTLADHEVGSSKCRRIILTPILITSPNSTSLAFRLPSIIVPKLEVLVYTLPEQINHPGGHKDYKCQLCTFQHTNKYCMVTHIWQHLEISVGCPMCSKGFQNAASLCKHGRKYCCVT